MNERLDSPTDYKKEVPLMTLQELFSFDENDLRFNRNGRLSPAQQARWQQGLSRGRRFQHGGAIILALVLGGILVGGVRYVGTFFPAVLCGS